ncbi:MAG: hypothetical protein IIY55_01940, partial [Blautia sp.]|nr:hypothetical protein [Blautia sp.]
CRKGRDCALSSNECPLCGNQGGTADLLRPYLGRSFFMCDKDVRRAACLRRRTLDGERSSKGMP